MACRSTGLTAKGVAAAKHPGGITRPVRVGDGGGLYLQITAGGSKSWLFRYRLKGRDREMGLGGADPDGRFGGVTLAEAREKAAEARRMLRDGHDPLDQRDAAKASQEAQEAADVVSVRTFQSVTESMLAERESGWSNPKHRAQWETTLRSYAFPHLGEKDVRTIDTEDVLSVLRPIWPKTPETASRLRGRIEAVLDFAKVRGWRQEENPARWRGHLAEVLPKPQRVKRVEHRPSLPWRDMPVFMQALADRTGVAVQALAFVILTTARTGEVRLARWQEIDWKEAVWTVPAERMKAKRRHRVPLCAAALEILRSAQRDAKGHDSLIFPSPTRGKVPLSDMTLSAVVRRMNEDAGGTQPRWRDVEGRAVVPHGFRSTFRDWAGETRQDGRDVAEAALAHVVRNKAEAAYARSDLLEKRRVLMEAWAEWCLSKPQQPDTGGPVPT
ncbi:integrase arm-type DNA-binding domain-containing protein [Roseomonas aerophila]|uniref:Integrase arm-type DNA-binding domain-containing protein n=1 Tax=Teichococcus aerophilus TaxID=1224513 RepID=A0ABR7RPI7_9PROT|nr:site-specific integrase [Pseudoroseomonas aerophila]MBC9208209.1 integrase arm-type DNA-binding domain-containing protein [Pseudoroseomonas aerophila]